MPHRSALFLLAAALLAPGAAAAQRDSFALWEGATAERVFGPAQGEAQSLGAPREFEVLDASQALLLAQDGRLYDLGRKPPALIGEAPKLGSIAVLRGGLIAVQGERLGYFEDARFVPRLSLPESGLRVVAGADDEIYLYGPSGGGSAIYHLKDWKIWPILRLPARDIDALATVGERIFFSAGGSIYTFTKGESASLLFVAPGEKSIDSLAADPRAGLLYFSAGERVYAMRAGVAFSVLAGVRGILRWSHNALFVLDRSRLQLIKVSGLEQITQARAAPGAAPRPSIEAAGGAGGGFKE